MALRDLLVTIPSDEELDSHFRMFNRPEILDLINKVGDIEHPVPLGMTLMRKVPEFRKLAVKGWLQITFCIGDNGGRSKAQNSLSTFRII